jgi:hypothetical protein
MNYEIHNPELIGIYGDYTIYLKYNDGRIKDQDISNYKPLLYPLEYLTKEIEVNGEKFVPIEWLNKNKSVKLIKVTNTKGNIEVFNGKTSNLRFFEYCVIEKLAQWHIDFQGLIEAGLAIDINTLNN